MISNSFGYTFNSWTNSSIATLKHITIDSVSQMTRNNSETELWDDGRRLTPVALSAMVSANKTVDLRMAYILHHTHPLKLSRIKAPYINGVADGLRPPDKIFLNYILSTE